MAPGLNGRIDPGLSAVQEKFPALTPRSGEKRCLIPPEVLRGLPPIGANLSPSTLIHVVLDASGESFYIAQGAMRENELFLRGFVVRQCKLKFPLQLTIALSELERGDWIWGEAPRLRPHFFRRTWEGIKDEIFPR
jgi:hypothetical protein